MDVRKVCPDSEEERENKEPHIAEAILNQTPLNKEDLKKSARLLNDRYHVKTFVRDSTDVEDLENVEAPIFVLWNVEETQWVLIYVVPRGEVFYSNNCEITSIKYELRRVFPREDIIFFHCRDCLEFSALASLTNLKILLKNLDSDLREISLCDYGGVIKIQLQILLRCYLPKLSEKEGFLEALKGFFDNLPLELVENMEKYNMEIDPNAEESRAAKKVSFDKEKIQQFVDNFCTEVEGTQKLIIEHKYPEEMKIFRRVFELLQLHEVGEGFTKAIELISSQLSIDAQKIISFFECSREENANLVEEKRSEGDVKMIVSIDEILTKLQEIKSEENDMYAKHWRQLLDELGKGFSERFYVTCEQIFQTVDGTREKSKSWFQKANYYSRKKQMSKIRKWATDVSKLETTKDYEDLVLKLDQAFFIITGKRLRYTQILALLAFCCDDSSAGRLCQIQTGEGKTVIVALVAIFQALKGHRIDIITSSPILANEAVKEMQPLYNLFGLSVDTNVDNSSGDYTCDVLYGTIGGFQFDYLKDQIDGQNIRRDRNFDVVILDEVDSMLVDNGEHLAQIASPFPGMECLRLLYIKIWDKVQNESATEDTVTSEMEQELESNIKYLIPEHLIGFVDFQLKYWVENAFHAKNHYHEFRQYRIQCGLEEELQVVPIDFLNTGVAMKNLVWSAGLTQFIQLKHNIELTFENLTSCFISNMGFIRKYDKRNIFGLSGTLGSQNEQDLLYDIYEVIFKILPTYKEKNFVRYEGLVAESELDWKYLVASSAIQKCANRRATLIVCKTQDDVIKLAAMFHFIENPTEELQQLYHRVLDLEEGTEVGFNPTDILRMVFARIPFNLRKYSSEEDVQQTETPVRPGDIILATNIAGRGTDFKTSKELEENGGLHVCVSFLPRNQRVEEQAFGRTSRQGSSGSGQLIIRPEEVEMLGRANVKPEEELLPDYESSCQRGTTDEVEGLGEVRGIVAETEIHWKLLVATSALQKCENGRAVLIICKNRFDVAKLEKMFQCIQNLSNNDVAIYLKAFNQMNMRSGFDSKAAIDVISRRIKFNVKINFTGGTGTDIQPGDVILTENFHGCDRNMKISTNGDIHICMTFVPKNSSFFRTRTFQGKNENLQYIVKKSETKSPKIVGDATFAPILTTRDRLEEQRLKEIKDVSVQQLEFKDKLFDLFVTDFKSLKETYKDPKDRFMLEDYKECFALWFEMRCKNIKDVESAGKEYEIFKEKAGKYSEGAIIHNPLNCLAAHFYHSRRPNSEEEAQKKLTEALDLSKGALMHGVYLKQAQHSIDNAGQITRRLMNIFKKMFFFKQSKNERYKPEALESLSQAEKLLGEEIEHLVRFLDNLSGELSEKRAVKVTNARLCYLKLFQSNVKEQVKLLKDLRSSQEDVAYKVKLPFDSETPFEKRIETVTKELRNAGLDTFCVLTKIYDPDDVKMKTCLLELVAAIGALGVAYFFPPLIPKMTTLALNLIVDVLQEIIMEMLTGGQEEFNREAFIYRKCFKVMTMVVVAEGSLISNSKEVRIGLFLFKRIINMCTQNISPEFRHSHPVLAGVLEGCVDFVEDYNLALGLRNLAIEDWGSICQRMSTNGLTRDLVKTVGVKILKENALYHITKTSNLQKIKKAVGPFLYTNFFKTKSIVPLIRVYLLRHKEFGKKLRSNEKEKIDEIVDKYLRENWKFSVQWENVIYFAIESANMLYFESEVTLANLGTFLLDSFKLLSPAVSILSGDECKAAVENLCAALDEELKAGGAEQNAIEIICERIAEAVFNKLFYR